ncbi:porphobilinogen deaminase, dipyromethane cofactor binding domain-containing protein [Dactylonectria estremocensis]|uniref:Porphobilinogen deaminase n=1 Tax=Dactylonectria estremocensis TaxID=1079267 RepID=A0A9P9FDG4_9HYPO|nr:porphobilinogen deaminase, dipyromethane cofactor binding domain-containing protein [Dactylonectria estremocensis]
MSGSQVSPAGRKVLKVGTRESPLAMAQAHIVVNSLKTHFPEHDFEIHGMTTTGDRDQKTALYNFGSKALWTSQLEERLVKKELDFVVHCLKDMPTALPEGCVIGCVTAREDPRDTLVIKTALVEKHGWKTLADLPDGSVIGTSSVRRIAQLVRRYPKLKFKDHRGNIQTRLRKLKEDPELTAIILAAAGLQRMELDSHISQFLEKDNGGILWAVGQGALAVECREGDDLVLNILNKIEDKQTMLACEVERSVMRTLEGGCSVPIGVETKWVDGKLRMRASVVSLRGEEGVECEIIEAIATREAADRFGKRVAQELVDRGADKILNAIVASRQIPETVAGDKST